MNTLVDVKNNTTISYRRKLPTVQYKPVKSPQTFTSKPSIVGIGPRSKWSDWVGRESASLNHQYQT